jgi:hypothetical protein
MKELLPLFPLTLDEAQHKCLLLECPKHVHSRGLSLTGARITV